MVSFVVLCAAARLESERAPLPSSKIGGAIPSNSYPISGPNRSSLKSMTGDTFRARGGGTTLDAGGETRVGVFSGSKTCPLPADAVGILFLGVGVESRLGFGLVKLGLIAGCSKFFNSAFLLISSFVSHSSSLPSQYKATSFSF
jgi:hypothetical protein